MKNDSKMSSLVVLGIGIAYLIVGILYGFGIGDGKTVLICSIISLLMAVIDILETSIDVYKKMQYKVLTTSVCILNVWICQNSDTVYSEKEEKLRNFKHDQEVIKEKFFKIIKPLTIFKNILLLGGVILIFILLSFSNIKGNEKLSDTMSILSFSIIFISMAIQLYMQQYFSETEKMIDSIMKTLEKKDEK